MHRVRPRRGSVRMHAESAGGFVTVLNESTEFTIRFNNTCCNLDAVGRHARQFSPPVRSSMNIFLSGHFRLCQRNSFPDKFVETDRPSDRFAFFYQRADSRRITSLARFPSRAIRWTASRASSRLGGTAASQRVKRRLRSSPLRPAAD
jgi:hypothetical protein